MKDIFFFFKHKTAYEMRISDWSSDVCSSDLADLHASAQQRAAEACRSASRYSVGASRRSIRRVRCVHQQRPGARRAHRRPIEFPDRKSVVLGQSVYVRVDLGGRRFIKKKKRKKSIKPRTTKNKKKKTR